MSDCAGFWSEVGTGIKWLLLAMASVWLLTGEAPWRK